MRLRETIIGVFVALIVVCLFVFLNAQRYLQITYIPNQDQPYIARFAPHQRVDETSVIRFMDDPVYLDVRLPRNFEQLVLKIQYVAHPEFQARLGMIANQSGDMNFFDLVPGTGKVQEAQIYIPAEKVYQENGKSRFLMSLPGIEEGNTFVIQQLDVDVTLQPFHARQYVKDLIRQLFYEKEPVF